MYALMEWDTPIQINLGRRTTRDGFMAAMDAALLSGNYPKEMDVQSALFSMNQHHHVLKSRKSFLMTQTSSCWQLGTLISTVAL